MTKEQRYYQYETESKMYALRAKDRYDKGDQEKACSLYHKAYTHMKMANGFLLSMMKDHGTHILLEEETNHEM